jgi:hypothetical protein
MMKRNFRTRGYLLLGGVAAIFVFLAQFDFRPWHEAAFAQQSSKPTNSEIRLSVERQEDSPLLITGANFIPTNPYAPNFSFLVTNASRKSIRAYTVQTVVTFGDQGARVVGSSLNHLVSKDLLLREGQTRQKIEPGNDTYPEVVREVVLSVDFVEFDDGSTWGKDAHRSAEVLAGQRAGGKAAIRYFRELLSQDKLQVSEIEDRAIEVLNEEKSNASASWKRGYEIGIGIVRNRLAKAYSLGNEHLRKELENPFDASEGRIKL